MRARRITASSAKSWISQIMGRLLLRQDGEGEIPLCDVAVVGEYEPMQGIGTRGKMSRYAPEGLWTGLFAWCKCNVAAILPCEREMAAASVNARVKVQFDRKISGGDSLLYLRRGSYQDGVSEAGARERIEAEEEANEPEGCAHLEHRSSLHHHSGPNGQFVYARDEASAHGIGLEEGNGGLALFVETRATEASITLPGVEALCSVFSEHKGFRRQE